MRSLGQAAPTDMPARSELDRYVEILRQTPEYLRGLDKYTPELADRELADWLKCSVFACTEWGYDFPFATPDGERISGSISSLTDPEGGASFKRFNYSFVMLPRPAGNGRMRVEFSFHKDHTGYLWMGECNNSAANTIHDPQEAWATWMARRAIEEF